MTDSFTPGPFGNVERKLPVIGRAVEGALDKLAPEHPCVFALFVIDPETGAICWTSNGERESFRAALAEFLSRQSH